MKSSSYLFFLFLLSIQIACNVEDPIIKDTPVITWSNPDDIAFGTQLTSTQLNATAEIDGVFNYTPELGTSLAEGSDQDLMVEFTPTDISTNSVVTETVKINVTAGTDAMFNDDFTYGKAVDIDGNEYKTITIGGQTWMAENLRTTRFRNGVGIPEVTDDAAWAALTTAGVSNYENSTDIDYVATHGRLYNWAAVSDSRNIAPEGWHVASDAEWTVLSTFLGGEEEAGAKLKESSTLHWNTPNLNANNSSGFTALPSGRREYFDGSFLNLGFNTFWWTSSTYDGNYAWYRYMNYDEVNIYRANFHSTYGYSVRCVKDE